MRNPADMVVRSSLEEILESLQQNDEKPKDVLPALPSRPTSRGRLPSARRSLPVNFKVENAVSGTLPWSQEKEREETEAVLNSRILGKEEQEESQFAKLPELESYEEMSEEGDGLHCLAALSDSTVRFNEIFRSGEDKQVLLKKIAALENARKNTIERIVWVQKQFRGLQVHRHFQELKRAAIILQTSIRGYLAWKKLSNLRSRREKICHEKINVEMHKNLSERKDFFEKHPQVQVLALAELQSRALQAEAMLSQKEDECASLREKLQLSDIRWLENDAMMKSKEEMWQKQLTSLQVRLAASKKSEACGRPDLSPVHHNHQNYDSEDGISTRMHTPDATPPKQIPVAAAAPTRDNQAKDDRVGLLARELDQRMQAFEDEARIIHQLNPEEEFQNLKVRFNAWKKDFKVRLRETKVAIRKSGVPEGDKKQKRWWIKRMIKI